MTVRVLTLLAASLLAACDQPTGPAAPSSSPELRSTTTHVTRREPFAFTAFEQCVGEPLDVSGTAQTTLNVVTADATSTSQHTFYSVAATGTAVGEVTGTVYRFQDVSQSSFDSPTAEAVHGIFTNHEVLHLIGQGSAPNAAVRIAFHLVFTGTGEPKLLFDTSDVSCPQ